MYYIVAGGMIVDAQLQAPDQETLQKWANLVDEEVFVIEGQHAGLSAEPQTKGGDA